MRSTSYSILFGAVATLAACGTDKAVLRGTANGSSIETARQALSEGEAGTSLAIAKGVLSSRPDDVPALVQAGDAELALADRTAAQISYRRALARSPEDVHARLGLGKLQISDNLSGAESTFRNVLVSAPRDVSALNDLGYVLDIQDRHAEAQTCYEHAIAIDPERPSSHVNLALSLALSGQPERAEQILQNVTVGSGYSRKVRLDFAVAQVMAGHDKDAAETLSTDLSPTETRSALEGLSRLRPSMPISSCQKGRPTGTNSPEC